MATYVALLGVASMGLGLLFLVAMILPGLVKMIFIPIFFVFFLALHYVTWGRSMMRQKIVYDAQNPDSTPQPTRPTTDIDG
ncbi:MAG: hypothetical protein O3A29_00980 [Planctomycetota bacterium]|nr:hypothetical protein [Planctomycetota bacterium]